MSTHFPNKHAECPHIILLGKQSFLETFGTDPAKGYNRFVGAEPLLAIFQTFLRSFRLHEVSQL